MQAAVVETPGQHAAADAVVYQQIERHVFDEEFGIVLHALLVERVEHRMPGAVGRGAGALGQALAPLHGVAAERALINQPVLGARERHAHMFELDDRRHRVLAHVFDRILVAEPVRPLDRVVHVPAPVILAHIAEGRADASLSGDGMAAGREHLADAGGLQTGHGHAEGRAQPRAAAPDNDDVIVVLVDRICLGHAFSFRNSRNLMPTGA